MIQGRYVTFTWQQLAQALTVDIIRRLWDAGEYRQNKWLKMIHDNWFDVWVEWKTDLTMRDLDRQVEEMFLEWEEDHWSDDWTFEEDLDGETPLGGEMRLRAPFMDKDEP